MSSSPEALEPATPGRKVPTWLLALGPLVLIALAIAAFAALDGPGLAQRNGVPVEELAFEHTVLKPGSIELTVRNDGPDPITIAQVSVNDAYQPFTGGRTAIDSLETETLKISEPWIEGESYEISLLTATGATIVHEIPAAAETPSNDLNFYGLMALLGIYVGVIPIALGMLWLPLLRRIPGDWLRAVLGLTVGLLMFLAVDATLEGIDLAGQGAQAFGGAALVIVGGIAAYVILSGFSNWLSERSTAASGKSKAAPAAVAMMIAVGIGLHNLGEGLAIGAAYTTGALALGAFLVIGFALHNTTEGLAIVSPIAKSKPSIGRLAVLGLIAGAPAILGAWIGAVAFNPTVAALLFGVGAGAIVQVIAQIWPSLRNKHGHTLDPITVGGILVGILIMFATGLLVAI